MFALSLPCTAIEPTWNHAVQVSASVVESPARITLSWPQDTSGTPISYTIYRKLPNQSAWTFLATLPGASVSYEDNTVTAGTVYEYQVDKDRGSYRGYGFIHAGIRAALPDSRGKVILLVDNSMSTALATELNRLRDDLTGDGWTVIRHDVARNDSPVNIKALIQADYNADQSNVKAVFLFGRIPVPYSGDAGLVPDGHDNNPTIEGDHRGAWPADVYYGAMTGWTDSTVNFTSQNTQPPFAARLTNTPGDGKFDQVVIPSTVVLQVGRVDFSRMPGTDQDMPAWQAFDPEVELLRNYLNKDHAFRHRAGALGAVPRTAIVADHMGIANGEATAASAYRGFAPIVGTANISSNDAAGWWYNQVTSNSYLLSYACGSGDIWAINGPGPTNGYSLTHQNVYFGDVRTVFSFLFGSWFGDFDAINYQDKSNNLMRSFLATDTYGLVAAWSGRPHWYIHPLGMGETIGYCAQITQNNSGLYAGYNTQVDNAHKVHILLLGDPTLRLYPVVPPTNVTAAGSGGSVVIGWTASTESNIQGYHVYRGSSANGPFARITNTLVTGASYSDTSPVPGSTYLVKAVKLEQTPSGTFFNASQGIRATSGTGPAAPSGLTASAISSSRIDLAWTDNASDETQFLVERSTDGVNFTQVHATGAPNVISYSDTSLSASTLYYYRVRAANAQGSSGSSNVASATTAGGSGGGADTVWIDDALPAGAGGEGSSTGPTWTWITSSPAPFLGTKAHESPKIANDAHDHWFGWSNQNLPIGTGDKLIAYVWLDPVNTPSEIMIAWSTNTSWEHRAYWGANIVQRGVDGTVSQRYIGALPAAGQWARLEVSASLVGLDGDTVTGISFMAFNGRAVWDSVGKSASIAPPTFSPSGGSFTSPQSVTISAPGMNVRYTTDGSTPTATHGTLYSAPISISTTTTLKAVAYATGPSTSSVASTTYTFGTDTVWIDDALPSGAGGEGTSTGPTWNWITSSPTPFLGTKAHESPKIANDSHDHWFGWSNQNLPIGTGDKLIVYVWLDPVNTPSEIMISWSTNTSWEHRAYWGANIVQRGVDGTASQRYIGALPASGQWVRLEVPANLVGMAGETATGISFMTFNGRAVWDSVGKSSP